MRINAVHFLLIISHFLAAPIAAGHALLYKRDSRAAFGWVAVCLLFPLAGPVLYYLFGINRVRTRAKKLSGRLPVRLVVGFERPESPIGDLDLPVGELDRDVGIALVSQRITGRPLVSGNSVEVLHNGEEAYPAMLRAIGEARGTLCLSTYIFQVDATGRHFMEEIRKASDRGVDVKVLVDGMGERYSGKRVCSLLKGHGIETALFLPPRLFPPAVHVNLRNHRKILVVDGRVGFAGGMNIGDHHLAHNEANPARVADVHFRFTGPVVEQLEEAFYRGWQFAASRKSASPDSHHSGSGDGPARCRVVVDGPDEDIDKLAMVLAGTIASARRQVLIMTPYFLPTAEILAVLQSAALRGVEVTLVLPALSNLPYVHWATRNLLGDLLIYGVRVFYQPPPFSHSKLLVVDGSYALVGSANMDQRSLRLNFELGVEVVDPEFCHGLQDHILRTADRSRAVSLEEVDGRPLASRLRDAACWLFSPYL